mgnify:CR=1 FL=1
MKLKFYEVDSDYIKYLKDNGDEKIPNIEYAKHKKYITVMLIEKK